MMKKKYIDHYGIDSLPHLRIASENNLDIFLTLNRSLIKDREELEKIFKIKIRTPEELNEEETPKANMDNPEYKEEEKEHWQVSDDDLNWKPCLKCGGELTQKRKAFFECINCGQTYIADEEDMK